jgi:hypothetical protein
MLLSQYLRYTLRPFPTHKTVTGIESRPSFYFEWFLWSLIFVICTVGIHYSTKYFLPKWYSTLNKRKQKEFPAYAASLIHHYVVTPIGFYQIYLDFHRTETELSNIHYAPLAMFLGPFSLGYIVADFFTYALPTALSEGRIEYLLHHIITVWLILSLISGNGNLARSFPHLMILELSGLFFNTAWCIRQFPIWKESLLVRFLEIAFSLSFLLIRVIHLPLIFYSILTSPYSKELGIGRYSLIFIVFFQWYWFMTIAKGTIARFKGKNHTKEGGGHKKRDDEISSNSSNGSNNDSSKKRMTGNKNELLKYSLLNNRKQVKSD